MTLVASSCTDVLDQMPTTEDTSKDVYAEAANYKRVLAKIYACLLYTSPSPRD